MFKTEQSATPKCKQCGKPMEFAAEITPLGSRDGVRFFQCNACHTTHDQTIPEQAARAFNLLDKERWLKIAELWLQMAQEAEAASDTGGRR